MRQLLTGHVDEIAHADVQLARVVPFVEEKLEPFRFVLCEIDALIAAVEGQTLSVIVGRIAAVGRRTRVALGLDIGIDDIQVVVLPRGRRQRQRAQQQQDAQNGGQ